MLTDETNSSGSIKSISCSKAYTDIPIAHRSPSHDGHCRFIHGHNWDFIFTFECQEKDENGFVVDFGKLGHLKRAISDFDHALILNKTDPKAGLIRSFLGEEGIGNIILVDDCSCEGLASMFLDIADDIVRDITQGRAYCVSCTVNEDSKNSATATKFFSIQNIEEVKLDIDSEELTKTRASFLGEVI
ncbi:MAG: 6-pyruvoyl trahydropterin synthase family protein [Waterburya sp.]